MVVTTIEDKKEIELNLQIIPTVLQESIKNIIEKENYVKYDFILRDFNTFGDNFLGKVYEIDIIGETAKSKKETHIFVKQRVDIENFKIIPIANCYAREIFFYNDLAKVFKSLQDQAGVPLEDRYKIPKGYDEINNNAIILENLRKRGFRTYKKNEPLSIKYAELAIRELAKFHALTFAVEQKMPEYFKNKTKYVKSLKSPFDFDENWEGMMRNICGYIANLYDDEVKHKIENFIPTILEKLPKYYNDQSNVRCTLTHGDFKKNNLLVRLEDGEPEEIVPVDYQMMEYGSPIKDFHYFIFTSTDREFRKKHLNEIKELYLETLSRFLKYFDIDVESVYPRQEFEKLYTEWMDYGLMITLFLSLFLFAPDTGIDFENHTLTEVPYCPEMYDDILRGLVDDFVEWGYL